MAIPDAMFFWCFFGLKEHKYKLNYPEQLISMKLNLETVNNEWFLIFLKDQSQLQSKEKELKKLSDLLIKLEEKSQADSEAVKVAQDHFHAVSAGLSSNEGGEDKTLADQIMSKLTTFLDGERIFLV